jgi:hypothetical protein
LITKKIIAESTAAAGTVIIQAAIIFLIIPPDFRVISKAKLEVPNLGHLRGIKSSIWLKVDA